MGVRALPRGFLCYDVASLPTSMRCTQAKAIKQPFRRMTRVSSRHGFVASAEQSSALRGGPEQREQGMRCAWLGSQLELAVPAKQKGLEPLNPRFKAVKCCSIGNEHRRGHLK